MRETTDRATRPYHATLSEKAFQAQVVTLAKLSGWVGYHSWLSIRSTAGFPDLCLARPPRVVFAELKTDKGKCTPAQEAWLDVLGACPGVEVFCWRPSQWEEIVRVLAREGVTCSTGKTR